MNAFEARTFVIIREENNSAGSHPNDFISFTGTCSKISPCGYFYETAVSGNDIGQSDF